MWHKDGKSSPETPQPPVGTAKTQVTPEPAASSTFSPAPVTAASTPEPAVAQSSSGSSRIQAGLKINGEISGSSDLYIDGELQGKLRLGNAKLVIGPHGKVQADVEAGAITIEGSIQGNIKAGEGVHLGAGSRVQGSILTPRIGIDDGARLRGKVEMMKAGSAASVPATSSAASTSQAATTTLAANRATEAETTRAIAASAKSESR
ncbi:MAG TPA: polymer-forming cytoskeletal protein [Candidatus Baltobacteraceae bacterium]|nr:polymer-forming cytoskeletal protein [Candidatus Baltobacteraceae bacterium]